jgi:hypothetical protein
MADGERETVTVEADNIKDARAKAKAGAETGSTIGPPVLEAAPTRAARPTVGAGDVGEEQGGAGRAFSYVPPTPTTVGPVESYIDPTEWGDVTPGTTAPPRTTTFRDFTQSIDPDLFDPRSSTYVPPPVTTVPPPVRGFDPNIDPLINPDLFDPNAPLTPPGSGTFVPPPTVVEPTVNQWSPYFEPDAPVINPVVPQLPVPSVVNGGAANGGAVNGGADIVPPTLYPEQFGPDDPYAGGPLPPVNGGAGNGAGNGGAGGNGEVVVQDPATGLPVLTSRELMLDPFTERAGQRLALRNIFGDQATGVGPVSGYLQRQLKPLTSAFLGGTWADMARGFAQDQPLALAGQGGTAQGPPQYPYGSPALAGGGTTVDDLGGTSLQDFQAAQAAAEVGGTAAPATGVAAMPGYSFEDFLRTTRGQDTGLGGAYGQALQNVGYLRGLGQGGVPPALAGILSPETSQGTWDARNLLGAAQKGRYSGLVSRSFRQPSEQDLFADYVLARQDATAAGQAPQNFLNFAASRYGL